MNDLSKYISEYFKTYNFKDYTIYVNGEWTKWCNFNHNRIVWNIPSDSNERDWHFIYDEEISEVSMTVTTMTIKTKNGKEYLFIAKVKAKEEKAKDLILGARNSLYTRNLNTALDYLEKLEALMNE